MSETDTIFVGKKPLMTYVYAAERVSKTTRNCVKIVARGLLISDAVTIAEIFMRRLGKHKYEVEIGSVEMTDRRGRTIFVSTMTITVIVP